MKKFNGFEAYLIIEGLKLAAEDMKSGIEETLTKGKNPLMTTGYVDMVVKEAIEKINSLTIKQK